MSVPGPVAVSGGQSEGSSAPTAVVVNEVDLDAAPDTDSVDLQVPFSSSGGKSRAASRQPRQRRRFTFVSAGRCRDDESMLVGRGGT